MDVIDGGPRAGFHDYKEYHLPDSPKVQHPHEGLQTVTDGGYKRENLFN